MPTNFESLFPGGKPAEVGLRDDWIKTGQDPREFYGQLIRSQPGNFWIDPKTKVLVQKTGNAPWAEDQFGPTPENYNQSEVQIPLANGNAGYLVDGQLIDSGRAYTDKEDFMTKWGVPLVGMALGGIAGAHMAATGAATGGGSGLSTLSGNPGADTFWSTVGANTFGTAAGGIGLQGLTAEELAMMMASDLEYGSMTLAEIQAAMAAGGVSAAEIAAATSTLSTLTNGALGTGMNTVFMPNGDTGLIDPTITDLTPITPKPPVTPPAQPPGNPKLPDSVFNPPGTNNIPKLANLIAGGVDFGTSMRVADKYKEIFDKLLNKSDPFAGEREKYFPIVKSAVDNAAQYNSLAFRGLNDPNFWTEQSWLKGVGDYSANAAQRKLASQGYNYSGNTQQEIAKTLRDTMAQYIIPGQQNLISGANMAGNLVNTAGTLAGVQFNPAQAMGPLSNLATSGLNTFQQGLGSLFNNNGQPGQSLVEQGLGWMTNQFGRNSVLDDVYGTGGTFNSNGGWGTGNDYGNKDLGQFF